MSDSSSAAFPPPADRLAELVAPDEQRLAARMAQDAFTRIFRLTLTDEEAGLQAAVAEIGRRARTGALSAAGDGRAGIPRGGAAERAADGEDG